MSQLPREGAETVDNREAEQVNAIRNAEVGMLRDALTQLREENARHRKGADELIEEQAAIKSALGLLAGGVGLTLAEEVQKVVAENATLRQQVEELKMVADAAEQAEMRYHKDCVGAERQRDALQSTCERLEQEMRKEQVYFYGHYVVLKADVLKWADQLSSLLRSTREGTAARENGQRGKTDADVR